MEKCKHCGGDKHCEIFFVFGKPVIFNICCKNNLMDEIEIKKKTDPIIAGQLQKMAEKAITINFNKTVAKP